MIQPIPAVARRSRHFVEVLPEYVARPVPVSVLHSHGRSAPKRVRVVMSWLVELLTPLIAEAQR